jgi:hypothetical protein
MVQKARSLFRKKRSADKAIHAAGAPMPKVTLTLNDELFQEFAGYAVQAGMEVDEFLSREIQQRAAQLLPAAPKAWMPREQWDALVRGEQCPLCAEIASQEPVNPYGYTVADLGMSRLRLAVNRSWLLRLDLSEACTGVVPPHA